MLGQGKVTRPGYATSSGFNGRFRGFWRRTVLSVVDVSGRVKDHLPVLHQLIEADSAGAEGRSERAHCEHGGGVQQEVSVSFLSLPAAQSC